MTKVEENEEQVRNYTMPQTVQYPALLNMIGSVMFIAKVSPTAKLEETIILRLYVCLCVCVSVCMCGCVSVCPSAMTLK